MVSFCCGCVPSKPCCPSDVRCHNQLPSAGGLPSWFQAQPGAASPARTTSSLSQEEELRAGKYGVIRSLLRVLDDGASSKALLDTVIDACK